MTRHSRHTVRAWFVDQDGTLTEVGEIDVTLNFDESLSPYGDATLITAVTSPEQLEATDPASHRGIRLYIDMQESTGDGIIIYELTADLGGSVAEVTAAYGPDLTPAKITADYFVAWNTGGERPGGAIRANLIVTGRDVDYAAERMTFTAATDEALLEAYKLLATVPETSGSMSVRATVNFALGKIGAALASGGLDATIAEPDAIIWEPGTSGWDYARNVAEAAGLVVRCDETRTWTLTQRDATRPETVDLARFTGATERVELAGDLWADAVVVRYAWNDPTTGASKVKYETATLIAEPIKVVTVERDTPYPGPGAAQYWLKRLQGRGRILDLEQVGDYSLRPGMGFTTAALPRTVSPTGFLESVSWNMPSDRGSIRTRADVDVTGA